MQSVYRSTVGLIAILSAISAMPLVAQQASPANAPVAAPAAAAAEVPVKLVVLYSSGVGYFEHHGTVAGNATTELRFKTVQINDLLKSLVLQDLDKGQVSAITYPSQDPLAKLLKSFQVDVSQNLSRAELLTQLRGAKVTCHLLDGKALSGTIIGVEIEKVPSGEKGDLQEIPVLNLLNEQGATSIRMPTVQYVSFDDPRLQEELNKALSALVQARDQDKKAVSFQFTGEGNRRVKIGYVVETPIWKTSYRLLLDDGKDAKPFIQGWAIVENQTDTDWNNVQLSLVSGRPISFIQDLYQPLYIPRPVVQPELYASLKPSEYEEGMYRERGEADRMGGVAQGGGAGGFGGRNAAAPAQAKAAPMAARRALEARAGEADGMKMALAQSAVLADEKKADQLQAGEIASAASAASLGDLFQYTVSIPVTLPRQKSAMLPIIGENIQAQRVSIYNAGTLAKHPLNGAILTNTTGKHLLNGPITVLDNGAYGGDARISDLPPGQQRLISYGIDLKVIVDSTSSKQDETITAGKVVKGVLQVARKHLFTQEYKIENKADAEKTLVIEHPFRQGWTLLTPEKPMEKTDALYRFQLAAAAGKPANLKVQEEHTDWQSIAILPFDIEQLTWYSRNGQIAQDVRDALVKAIQLKQALVDAQRQMEQTRQKIAQITQAQSQTRENMKAIAPQAQASDYYNRLLKRMGDQDLQLDTQQKALDDQQQQFNTRQKELEDYLNNLTVG